jgi:16S rRNA G1207 methylase RsmC
VFNSWGEALKAAKTVASNPPLHVLIQPEEQMEMFETAKNNLAVISEAEVSDNCAG